MSDYMGSFPDLHDFYSAVANSLRKKLGQFLRRLLVLVVIGFGYGIVAAISFMIRPLHYFLTAMYGLVAISLLLYEVCTLKWPFVKKYPRNVVDWIGTGVFLFIFTFMLAQFVNMGIGIFFQKIGLQESSGIGLFAVGLIAVNRAIAVGSDKGEDSTDTSSVSQYMREISRDTIVGLSITSWIIFTFSPSEKLVPFYMSVLVFPVSQEYLVALATLVSVVLDYTGAWRKSRRPASSDPHTGPDFATAIVDTL
jgi:hypothetical protein